ncbi:MAG TPA: agmatine deiminase family protein [Gammaproteobacteria bacterium]|nr:agmatine deiminase family protein [Gammaproteobacteria bacterium]
MTGDELSADHADTPKARGYRQPAEWAPHEATWLSWPHNRDSWPGVFERAEPAMVELVRALAKCEPVYINVLDGDHERHVRKLLARVASSAALRFYRFPTNDAWARDHGAIFVTRPSAKEPRLAVDFDYNAWGGKYPPFDLDREIGRQMAEALGVPRYAIPNVVLEGGSIDVNGEGALLTTEQCLLNPNRNPTLTRADIERLLCDCLGVDEILWLGEGIEGDDTDGHIDDLTRFVGPRTVVTVVEPNRADPNHAPLAANRRLLDTLSVGGGRLTVVELPMPEPQYLEEQRLPASYANFYVANGAVLVPTFGCPADEVACATLRDCFPGRRVVGVDCRVLIAGLGALHCLTQQVPAAPAVAS